MKIYFYLLIISVPLLSQCNSNSEKGAVSDLLVDTIVWNDFERIDTKMYIPEELVKHRSYVNLDADPAYVFGGGDKIVIKKNIYVLDSRQKKLIVFDELGKGLMVLHRVGQGPEEYLQITDFDVDDDGKIYIVDGNSDKMNVYDQKGDYVLSKKFPFEADIIRLQEDDNILLGLSTWNKHEQTAGNRFAIVGEDMQILKTYFAFDDYHDDNYWLSLYRFMSNGERICYNKPIDDYVYLLSDKGDLESALYFDFGDNRIPLEWRKDVESHMDKIKEKYRCLKNHIVVTDTYILGSLWDRTETKPFLIDRIHSKVYLGGAIAESDVSDFVYFTDNSVVSLLSMGRQDILHAIQIPNDVQEHVRQGNFSLMITELL